MQLHESQKFIYSHFQFSFLVCRFRIFLKVQHSFQQTSNPTSLIPPGAYKHISYLKPDRVFNIEKRGCLIIPHGSKRSVFLLVILLDLKNTRSIGSSCESHVPELVQRETGVNFSIKVMTFSILEGYFVKLGQMTDSSLDALYVSI